MIELKGGDSPGGPATRRVEGHQFLPREHDVHWPRRNAFVDSKRQLRRSRVRPCQIHGDASAYACSCKRTCRPCGWQSWEKGYRQWGTGLCNVRCLKESVLVFCKSEIKVNVNIKLSDKGSNTHHNRGRVSKIGVNLENRVRVERVIQTEQILTEVFIECVLPYRKNNKHKQPRAKW